MASTADSLSGNIVLVKAAHTHSPCVMCVPMAASPQTPCLIGSDPASLTRPSRCLIMSPVMVGMDKPQFIKITYLSIARSGTTAVLCIIRIVFSSCQFGNLLSFCLSAAVPIVSSVVPALGSSGTARAVLTLYHLIRYRGRSSVST